MINKILKLQRQFLEEGRAFCFQAQSGSDYFNFALYPPKNSSGINTQYIHANSLKDLLVKLEFMALVTGSKPQGSTEDEDQL